MSLLVCVVVAMLSVVCFHRQIVDKLEGRKQCLSLLPQTKTPDQALSDSLKNILYGDLY